MLAASKTAKLPKAYFAWDDMLSNNANGFFPYTPATGLLYGLAEAIDMLNEEGLENVFARHNRLAETTRRAVRGWGLELWCRDAKYYSPAVTTVSMPDGHNADNFRKIVLDTFNMSLGTGLNKLAGKARSQSGSRPTSSSAPSVMSPEMPLNGSKIATRTARQRSRLGAP